MSEPLRHPDALAYLPGFLDSDRQAELERFLDAVPEVAPGHQEPAVAFTFTSPVVEGHVVVADRREAAAGWPVWSGSGPAVGVELPGPLKDLAREVGQCLTPLLPNLAGVLPDDLAFSSVYVDRYDAGGAFVAHTDRHCYGPVVAGVSIGPGECRITFRERAEVVFQQHLAPGSLYAFAGRLRRSPCTHEIGDVDGRRYGLTLRTSAERS